MSVSILIHDPLPASIEAFLEERRRSGADRYDELWEGVLHVAPAPTGGQGDLLLQVMEVLGPLARGAHMMPCAGGFNLGSAEDYRIPDGGIRRDRSDATYFGTAAVVLEVLSPGDESLAKLGFYCEHHVDEVLLVDPKAQTLTWLQLEGSGYVEVDHSSVIALSAQELFRAIVWPY